MQTAHEFFLHELGDMLDAERKLAEARESRRRSLAVPSSRKPLRISGNGAGGNRM